MLDVRYRSFDIVKTLFRYFFGGGNSDDTTLSLIYHKNICESISLNVLYKIIIIFNVLSYKTESFSETFDVSYSKSYMFHSKTVSNIPLGHKFIIFQEFGSKGILTKKIYTLTYSNLSVHKKITHYPFRHRKIFIYSL